MKTFFKNTTILKIIITLIFVAVPLTFVYAQTTGGTSISGDEICGGSVEAKCTLGDLRVIVGKALAFLVTIGLPLLVIFIVYRFIMAWFALQQGNAMAYKDALKKSMNAAMGFFMIVALFGGLFYFALQYLGVNKGVLDILKNLLSDGLVTHAYAQATAATNAAIPVVAQCNSPFNLTGVCSVYDFILAVLRLIVRFFVYPSLIVMWVWSGFSFVYAQGNPEGLNKAKKWLMWAFITTLVVFMLQSFLAAAQGTVSRILGGGKVGDGTQQTVTPSAANNGVVTGTADGRVEPAKGTTNAACQENGLNGTIDTTGKCNTASRGGTATTNNNGAQLIKEVAGWKYYTDGTSIGPDGTYYFQGKSITGPGGQGSPITAGSAVCSGVEPCTTSGGKAGKCSAGTCVEVWVDSCLEKGTQVNSQCIPSVGKLGMCKFDTKNKVMVCQPYTGIY